MSTKEKIVNYFSIDNLPDELKTFAGDVQRRAVDMANGLMEQGYKVPVAVSMATERARHWSGLSDAPMAHHVIPHPDGWAVMKADAERPSMVAATKQEAIDRGREIARNQKGGLVIHGEDGMVQDEHSYTAS